MCKNYGLKKKLSTAYNPQSNGIMEQVHQVLADALRTFELERQELSQTDPWGSFLAAAAFAICSTYHATLKATPAQLVFSWDMILPIEIKANWAMIYQQRQEQMIKNNNKENCAHISHTYKVGDQVLLKKPGKRKLEAPCTGPPSHMYMLMELLEFKMVLFLDA